jgi:hypothetical protein
MARIRHVVLVRFRDASAPDERQRFVEVVKQLRALPYVAEFTSGWDAGSGRYARSSDRWDWGFTLDFDEADGQRYADDPAHAAVAADVAAFAEAFAILDFRMDE